MPSESITHPQKLVALVVTRDRLTHLQVTLAALLASDPAHLSAVVIVDNASGDETAAWLAAQRDPRLCILTQTKNLGGAGGFETGLAHIRDHMDADWTLMMDDDARPAPDTLAQFHAGPRDGFDAWVSAVRYPSGGICEMNRPWVNPFWHLGGFLRGLLRGRGGFHIADSVYAADVPMEIDGGSFVGLFWSRRALKLAGLPQGRLFLYGDDVLYSLALRRAGGRVAFDPALGFLHDCETFGGGPDDNLIRPMWKVYYMRRNQLMVYRSAAGPLFRLVAALIVPRWRRQAAGYAGEAPLYRKVLDRAVADGMAQRTDVTFDQVLAFTRDL